MELTIKVKKVNNLKVVLLVSDRLSYRPKDYDELRHVAVICGLAEFPVRQNMTKLVELFDDHEGDLVDAPPDVLLGEPDEEYFTLCRVKNKTNEVEWFVHPEGYYAREKKLVKDQLHELGRRLCELYGTPTTLVEITDAINDVIKFDIPIPRSTVKGL